MKPERLLVIRLSALGDVAMTVPVLKQVLQHFPTLHITVLTQAAFKPLFDPLERTVVHVADTKAAHKGLKGLYHLYRELKSGYTFDAVADLHNVLRSKLLTFWFRAAGVKTATIDKGRKEKKQLTAKGNKKRVPLKTNFQRYRDVFERLGLSFELKVAQPVYGRRPLPVTAQTIFSNKKKLLIAPFAKHPEKMYPADKMQRVLNTLLQQNHLQLYLAGGGKKEMDLLNEWEKELPGIINLGGKFSFDEELSVISNMDAVISMDSANMHLASLFGVPVISVWGATHPYAGFYGWNQPTENAVQIDLYCRPCSVFGNKRCYRGDHACMKHLAEEKIIEAVRRITG